MAITIIDKAKNPHLSLCHKEQGYSANNRPVSLLMKASIKLTDELLKSLENLGLLKASEIKKSENKSENKSELNKSLVSEIIKNNLSKYNN